MKKILMALIILGACYNGAQAQKVCGTRQDRVCRRVGKNGVSCYKTNYAENFKVCQGDMGYYICCEAPNQYNSTNSGRAVVYTVQPKTRSAYAYQEPSQTQTSDVDMTIPQSQSYTVTNDRSYEGYYPKKGRIKVCYVGDNVAEENRAPYQGCPSPAYDGPEANRQRNLNVSNPEGMPPTGGRAY